VAHRARPTGPLDASSRECSEVCRD